MKSILFIKHGRFSGINERVAQQLRRQFPDHHLVVKDVRTDWIRHNVRIGLLNYLHTLCEFRSQLFRRQRGIGEVYLRTSFMFRHLRLLAKKEVDALGKDLHFTFASQSLYDVAVPGVPHFILTDHTHLANLYYPAFDRSSLLPEFVIQREREIYQRARHVFAMGTHVRRSLVEQYDMAESKASVVGAGANIPVSPTLDNDDYQNQAIGFVGIDWERKGGPVLLDAFSTLRSQFPEATLHIIGCSPREVPNGVIVHGRVAPEKVALLLSKVSVFAFPTLIEPLGIAPIEAACLNLPVVASTVGAMPDIVVHGETGLLVPPSDASELARALATFLQNPHLSRQFGQRGRQHALSHFTWDEVGRRIGNVVMNELQPSITSP